VTVGGGRHIFENTHPTSRIEGVMPFDCLMFFQFDVLALFKVISLLNPQIQALGAFGPIWTCAQALVFFRNSHIPTRF
jgi:hypothetical protein